MSSGDADPALASAGLADDRESVLVDMLRGLSCAADPARALEVMSTGINSLYGRGGFVSLSTRGLPAGSFRITRRLLDPCTASLDVGDVWASPVEPPAASGGLLGSVVAGGRPVRAWRLEAGEDPVLGDGLKGFRSMAAVPLFDGGAACNWAFQFREAEDAFSERDLEDMLLRANLVGNSVRLLHAKRGLEAARAEVRRELEKVAEIQRALLPGTLPDIPGVSVAVSYEAYDFAGGDYYNLHPLGVDGLGEGGADGRWGLMVADVSGHGVAAAVVMAMLQAVLMTLPMACQGDPGAVWGYLNRHLCAKRIRQTFVTGVVLGFNPQTRLLTYSRAGHPPGLVRRGVGADAEVFVLDAVGSVPLGVLDGESFDSGTFQMEPGDTLVLFTDGIVEARDPSGAMFGVEGIREALRACEGDAACTVSTLEDRLARHRAGAAPEDDQTVLVLRVER